MIRILLILCLFFASADQYPYKNGKPTKRGIELYTANEKAIIVKEFQLLIEDTLYSYDIKADDLSEYSDYDSTESGRFYPPDEVIVTNEIKYEDYQLSFIPKYKRKQYLNNNRLVKAVIVHELGHLYFYQMINDMIDAGEQVDPAYLNYRPAYAYNKKVSISSEVIEEGYCEYLVRAMGESIANEKQYVPKTIEDVRDELKLNDLKYIYGPVFVKAFLEKHGPREGLRRILLNKPPTHLQLLDPEAFFVDK